MVTTELEGACDMKNVTDQIEDILLDFEDEGVDIVLQEFTSEYGLQEYLYELECRKVYN